MILSKLIDTYFVMFVLFLGHLQQNIHEFTMIVDSWVSSLFCFNYMYYHCGFPGPLHYFIVSSIYYVCGSPGHHHYFVFISTICSVVVLS